MTRITFPTRISPAFGHGFNEFFIILNRIRELNPHEPIELDMTNCSFLTPFFILPIVLLIKEETKNRDIICTQGVNNTFKSYADTICYHTGIRPEDIHSENYEGYMNTFSSKSFIPIINFPAERNGEATKIRDTFLSVMNSLLKKQINLSGGVLTAVYYLIDEAINNIVDHSIEQRGFIFAQYYPSRRYIDICIADSGRGILQSYIDKGRSDILTDRDAIIAAGSGVSTKNRPGKEGRGFGITTSKNMLVNGLKGKYLLLSGNAFLLKDSDNEDVVDFRPSLKVNGTIVALRVPYSDVSGFDPSAFYEN